MYTVRNKPLTDLEYLTYICILLVLHIVVSKIDNKYTRISDSRIIQSILKRKNNSIELEESVNVENTLHERCKTSPLIHRKRKKVNKEVDNVNISCESNQLEELVRRKIKMLQLGNEKKSLISIVEEVEIVIVTKVISEVVSKVTTSSSCDENFSSHLTQYQLAIQASRCLYSWAALLMQKIRSYMYMYRLVEHQSQEVALSESIGNQSMLLCLLISVENCCFRCPDNQMTLSAIVTDELIQLLMLIGPSADTYNEVSGYNHLFPTDY